MSGISHVRLLSLLALVGIFGLLIVGCAQATPQPATVVQTVEVVKEVEVEKTVEVPVTVTPEPAGPAGPKVLRITNAEPTQGTSPLTGGTSASMRVWELMHDPLWDRDENFQAIPWLAESWEMEEDGRVWTFKLRDGLTFSDGSPLTAEDVKASFEYVGTSELWSGRIEQIENIEVVDPLTVKFTMTRPMPDFLELPGANVQFSIFSKEAIEAGADWNQPNQVYSGPYMLKEYIPKDHLVLVRNPNYWNKGYPKFDEIYWSFTEDATAGVAAVESGTADVYSPVPAKDVPRLKLMPTVAVYEANSGNYMGFGFDRSKPPFDDTRVRKAVALILEPDERTEVCWFGTGNSLYGGFLYEWQTDFYDGFQPYQNLSREERIAQASALLDEAGWTLGPDGMRVAEGIEGVADGTAFSVNVPYEANWPAAECHTQLLQNWGKDIGIDLRPERYDPGAFWNDAIDGKFQMWHVGIPGSIYAPDSIYQVAHSTGSWNPYWFHGQDAELDQMLDAMAAETDLVKKKELLSQVNQKMAEEAYVVADGSQNTLVLTTARLQGFFARADDSSRALILSDLAPQ